MLVSIVKWIKKYSEDNGIETLVIGVSGGIDSAVTSTLCALTKMRVIAINMPIHQDKVLDSRSDKHINWLLSNYSNVESNKIDLTESFDSFSSVFSDSNKDSLSLANSRARLRMMALYQIAKEIGIIQEIIDAPPTDGLWNDGRTDEEQLGAPYAEIEKAMIYAEENNLSEFSPTGDEKFDSVLNTYFYHRNKNLHKMKTIPIYYKDSEHVMHSNGPN